MAPYGGAGGCEAYAPVLQRTHMLCEACATAASEVCHKRSLVRLTAQCMHVQSGCSTQLLVQT